MGNSPLSDAQARTARSVEAGEVLAALDDEDCRQLLRAAAGTAMSASELAEECDLPLSTTYRKVDILEEAGLLAEELRLCPSGKHTSEYTLSVESLEFSLGPDGIEMAVTDRTDERKATRVLAGAD